MYKRCWQVCVFAFLQGNVKGWVQSALFAAVWCGAPTTQFTLKARTPGEKRCSLSVKGSKMCNKFTKEAALPPRNIWRGDKTAIPATTHNSVWVITAPTQAPGVLNSFWVSLYKTRTCATGNCTAPSSQPGLLWRVASDILPPTMLHKPRHGKFLRKLLSLQNVFSSSHPSSWQLGEERNWKGKHT